MIELEYSLTENDHLNFQLYTASISKSIKKQRLRGLLILPIIHLAFSIYYLVQGKWSGAIIFLFFGLLWLLLYPIWDRKYYSNYYKKYYREHFKETAHRKSKILFAKDFIETSDEGGLAKHFTTEVKSIMELSRIIIIPLKTGQSIIIPKRELTDLDKIKLKELSKQWNVEYFENNDWKWK